MAAISAYYQTMASPEMICGSCRLFDRKNAIGELVGLTDSANGKINKGYCRGTKGLLLGVRREIDLCKMPEGTFKAVPASLTQSPSTLQESPAL